MPPSSGPNSGFWRGAVSRAISALDAAKLRLAPPAKPKKRPRFVAVPPLPTPPEGSRFPKEGDVYEATVDVPVTYGTHYFDLPYTGGGNAVLPKGERVRVRDARGERPLGVYCDPLRYEELHERIVAAWERTDELYRGYYLALDTATLVTSFRLISCGAAGA